MHLRRSIVGATLLALTLTLASCGGGDGDEGGGARADGAAGAASPSKDTSQDPAKDPASVEGFWAEVEQIADQPGVDLQAALLPKPPRGFTEADVRALADRARTVLVRSFAPNLSSMSPGAAAKLVLAEELPATRDPYVASVRKNVGKGNAWEWAVASRYAEPPAEATYLNVKWSAEKVPSRYATGEKAPFLTVGLQAVVKQEAKDEQGEARPVIARRTVYFSSFEPQDTSGAWYPAMNVVLSYAGGVDVCLLLDRSLIRADPGKPKHRESMIEDFREQVEAKRFVTGNDTDESDAKSFSESCD